MATTPARTSAYRIGRRHERIAMVVPATLCIDSEEEGEMVGHPSYTLDISQRGAKLRASVTLRPGQSVIIVPDQGPAHAVLGRVIWVTKVGFQQECKLGLEFRNPTPVACWGSASDRRTLNTAKFLGLLLNFGREQ